MKKPIKLVRSAATTPVVDDDATALAVGREILRLAKAKNGKFMLHIWFTGQGVQANVSNDAHSWGVSIKRTVSAAILDVLSRR